MERNKILEEFRSRFVNVHALTVATVSVVEILGYLVFLKIGQVQLSLDDIYLQNNVLLPILINLIAHLWARVVVFKSSCDDSFKNASIIYAALVTTAVVSICHREFLMTSCSFIFPMVLSTVFNNKKLLRQSLCVELIISGTVGFLLYYENAIDTHKAITLIILLGFILVSYNCAIISIKFSEKSFEVIKNQATDNDRLKDRIRHDAMTGLYNHRAFYSILGQAMEAHHSKRKKVCLAVIDIDDFKMVNDTYGHEYGDLVIITLADILKNGCEDAKVCRYGGEEFAIIFTDKSESEACEVAKVLLEKFSSYEFDFTDDKYTFSCGITMYDGLMSKEALFGEADKKMYEAKKNGKNRVVV